MNNKIEKSDVLDQIKNFYNMIIVAVSAIPGTFDYDFKKDIANYYLNLFYLFNVLNDENLKCIEYIQEDKLYDITMIREREEFEEQVPFFVSGAIDMCELYGEKSIPVFDNLYDILMPFYESSGSCLIMYTNKSGDLNELISYYKHIRNTEKEWNKYLEKNGLSKKEPLKFTLTSNDRSLDEIIEDYLDLGNNY